MSVDPKIVQEQITRDVDAWVVQCRAMATSMGLTRADSDELDRIGSRITEALTKMIGICILLGRLPLDKRFTGGEYVLKSCLHSLRDAREHEETFGVEAALKATSAAFDAMNASAEG